MISKLLKGVEALPDFEVDHNTFVLSMHKSAATDYWIGETSDYKSAAHETVTYRKYIDLKTNKRIFLSEEDFNFFKNLIEWRKEHDNKFVRKLIEINDE